MKHVYMVTVGCYSDYRVVGIFSTKEHADKICEKVCGEVEKMIIDPFISEMNQGLKLYHIVMDYSGDVEKCFESSIECNEPLKRWPRTQAPAWRKGTISDAVFGDVWAKDEQHAAKIANEFRAQAIAEGKMKHKDEVKK